MAELAGVISMASGRRGNCAVQSTGRITCWGQTLLSEDDAQTYDVFVADAP